MIETLTDTGASLYVLVISTSRKKTIRSPPDLNDDAVGDSTVYVRYQPI